MNAPKNNDEKDRFAPDKLLAIFKKTRFLNYLIAAVIIHVVVISGFSVSYLLDKSFPARVVAREQAEKDRLDAEKKVEEGKRAAAMTNAPAAASNGAAIATSTSNTAPATDALITDNTNNPIIKETTEAATLKELPKADDLGISITDTNPR